MKKITFMTGNKDKADYYSQYLGMSLLHEKIDLDEIQSLDLQEIVVHKVRQAYDHVQGPVIVGDASLEFSALGRLPGPLVKWFMEDMSFEEICNLVEGKDRSATARCVIGYYDGITEQYFEGSLAGKVPEKPRGKKGFGWDQIFIPEGYDITRAEMNEKDDQKTFLQINPLEKLKKYLEE